MAKSIRRVECIVIARIAPATRFALVILVASFTLAFSNFTKSAAAEEPAAETVPLPPERPAIPNPATTSTATSGTTHEPPATHPDDDAPLLTIETPSVKAGQPASFSLYGPETFLRGASGHLTVKDAFGRVLKTADLQIADLPYSEGKPRQIQIAIEHPLAREHLLELSISRAEQKTVELSCAFSVELARAAGAGPGSPWESWISLISTPPANGKWDPLLDLGISGAVQYRLHPARREALRKGQALFYVENISRQMLSRYHTEPGLWEKTLNAMSADASGRGPRSREPSLCSQEFAETFAKELKRHAEVYSKDPPLFYSLGSEPSMTRLAAAADFDFSAASITEFQRWLERDEYGTLAALNASWGTNFAAWADVMPMTTDEARLRMSDGVMNFGPWVDFRDFQDYTFARILREGGEFLRKTDPAAKAGITGAMGAFAFGGWDWARLSQSLDLVEAYDIGGARALWRDLAPGKPALAIIPAPRDDKPETLNEISRTLWNLALESGPRGTVLWSDDAAATPGSAAPGSPLIDREGKPSPALMAMGPLLKSLSADGGTVLAHSHRTDVGVAILYSPASIRMTWLLEADHFHGAKWLDSWGRDTTAERRESLQLRLRESWGKLLDDAGLSWRFISSAQLEKREILNKDSNIRTVVLPRTVCLSDTEAEVLKQFVNGGGKIVADASCGRFDEHGHIRKKPALDELFGIDSSNEPFFAEPMNPLALIKPPANAKIENIEELAPVFSDKVIAATPVPFQAAYRGSPVLRSTGWAAYLNLDLSDYLRWRLHADRPRARVTLDAIQQAILHFAREASPIDWAASKLPPGTRIVPLQLGSGPEAPKLLALMRNPQARLHELGADGDGNWAFDKAEPFKLTLKQPAIIRQIYPRNPAVADGAGKPTLVLEGSLDPTLPAIFVLQSGAQKPPVATAPEKLNAGEIAEIKITSPVAGVPRIYAIAVKGPDGVERSYYGKTIYSPDGSAAHSIPTALNDAAGAWSVLVRDLLSGGETSVTYGVVAPAGTGAK